MEKLYPNGRFVEPKSATSHFHIREGDVVLDVGAGSGYFTPHLSIAAGESGKVYASEIQKNLVDTLNDFITSSNIKNVIPLWSNIEKPNGVQIKDAEIDIVVMVNTLFQLEHKEQALKEISRVLRVGGKVCVIDWSESFSGLGPTDEMVFDQKSAEALFESSGFVVESTFPSGDHHYGVTFRKV